MKMLKPADNQPIALMAVNNHVCGARALACHVHTHVNALILTDQLVFAGVRTRHARVRTPRQCKPLEKIG